MLSHVQITDGSIDALFLKKITASTSGRAVSVVDASGSTIATNWDNSTTVFGKEGDILKTRITQPMSWLICWNAKNCSTNFPDGVYAFATPIPSANIPLGLTTTVKTKITNNCLTDPSVAFIALRDNASKYFSPTENNHIYYCTDGEITSGFSITEIQKTIKNVLNELFKKYTIQLHIYTIEKTLTDYVEQVGSMAGGDFWKIFVDLKLTGIVSEFVSYNTRYPDGFQQIYNPQCPAGFIPGINNDCFSEKDTHKFILHLQNEVQGSNAQNDNALIDIVQKLTSTIKALAKDKSLQYKKALIQTFSNVFENTKLTPDDVKNILAETVSDDKQTMLVSEFRNMRKQNFKDNDNAMKINTAGTIGYISGKFISFPLDVVTNENGITTNISVSIIGDASHVVETFMINKNTYSCSSVKINDILIPVVPTKSGNDQGMRQFVRIILSNMYKVNIHDDQIIYIAMGIMLRSFLSPNMSKMGKDAFCSIATDMSNKTRLNVIETEMNRWERGELPIPNTAKIETFYGYMTKVCTLLNFDSLKKLCPMTIWYAICLAFGNDAMINKQLIHCLEAIKQDFPDINVSALTNPITLFSQQPFLEINPIIVREMPSDIDYNCIISFDDLSQTGGHQLMPHKSLTGHNCRPGFLISDNSLNTLFNNNDVRCMQCFVPINRDMFVHIEPKTGTDNIFPELIHDLFMQKTTTRTSSSTSPYASSSTSSSAGNQNPNGRRVCVVMKGPVGGGKTTFSSKIAELLREKSIFVVVEGMDKYSVQGIGSQSAIHTIQQQIKTANDRAFTDKLVVVIIDTCGERDSDVIFNHNFKEWDIIKVTPNFQGNDKLMNNFLAWTLRNVLRRKAISVDSAYYLSPIGAGVATCINVHKKKSDALYKGKYKHTFKWPNVNDSADNVITTLNPDADIYQQFLDTTHPLDTQVQSVFQKIIAM